MKRLHHCIIASNQVTLDGSLVFELPGDKSDGFFRAVYRHLALDYPKFFKMDRLCKLAFLGTELLVKAAGKIPLEENVALCFFNGQSSLDTDLQHQGLISAKSKVSPSVFVYTLANIMLGEIAIRHRWYGENLLILAPKFDYEAWSNEAALLLKAKRASSVLGGWVDLLGEAYRLELYLVTEA